MLQDGVESFEDASRDDFVSRLGAGFSAAQPVPFFVAVSNLECKSEVSTVRILAVLPLGCGRR